MGRGSQWTAVEDIELARAWVSISEDPVKGNEQKNDTFWGNIYDLWTAKTKLTTRTAQACKNRWSTLQRAVQKFCGYFQKVLDLNESGKTDEDKIADAEQTYETLEGHRFNFQQCWHVLRKCPKWAITTSSKRASQECSRDGATGENDSSDGNTTPPRPVGVKRSKLDVQQGLRDSDAVRRLALATEKKNTLFADHMLMKLLLRSNSPQNEALLSKLTEKYAAEVFDESE